MFWKIYFWFLAVVLVLACFTEDITDAWNILGLLIFLLALVGLFLHAYKKKLFNANFWKMFFPIYIVWNLAYDILIEPKISGENIELIPYLLAFMILFPLYVALYLYAFKFFDEIPNYQDISEQTENEVEAEEFNYPSILRRYLATFIDGVLIIIVLIIASYIFHLENEIGTVLRVVIILTMFFVYEPLFTSRFCTLGQKVMGIRIRKQSSLERISILSAYVRIVVKLLLGIISFFTIPFTRGRKAIHDFTVGSIVINANSH
jgi:uncharacterized RDD family membrane protein YckC